MGVSVKFIRVDYAPEEFTIENEEGAGTSFAVDFGGLYRNPTNSFSVGFAVTNMGPDISFIDREQSDPLPWTARLGAAYTLLSDEVSNFLVTADLEQSLVWLVDKDTDNRRSEIYHAGAEYRYVNMLSGRIGYIYDEDGDFRFGHIRTRLYLQGQVVARLRQRTAGRAARPRTSLVGIFYVLILSLPW